MRTASTSVCMCHYIRLYVNKTQHAPSTLELEKWSTCRLRCSSTWLSVLLNSNVLEPQHQNPTRIIAITFSGRSQQRDCVRHQPCPSRPLTHLCDRDSSHFHNIPKKKKTIVSQWDCVRQQPSSAHTLVRDSSVSVFTCQPLVALHQPSDQILTSSHE